MAKYLALVAGRITEVLGIATSAGAGDAGKIPQLDSSGKLDTTFMPAGIGAASFTATAVEAIAAGDFVNVHDVAGTRSIRKADATNPAKFANGFVLAAVSNAAVGTVLYGDVNSGQTGLTPGVLQYLSATTPGKATATPPSTAGQIVQQLGTSISTTEILSEIQTPITLA